jgi:hypothetical protein
MCFAGIPRVLSTLDLDSPCLTLDAIESNGSAVFRSEKLGHFHRLLETKSYHLKIGINGHRLRLLQEDRFEDLRPRR